jgi:pyruvate kinase
MASSRETPAIVATLGPASFHLAAEMAEVGASALRLNASHMAPADLEAVLADVRGLLPRLPVVVDLQGAKMRLGEFEARSLREGESLRLALEPSGESELPLPHPELFRALQPGWTLSCDDDRVRLSVRSVGEGSCEVVSSTAATLRPRKGVNLLEHPVLLDDLTPCDLEHLRRAIEHPPVAFACSFLRDGSEANWIRPRAPGCPVIGKVERRAALKHLDSVAAAVDELWICRGDLGAQLGPAEMAAWVGSFEPRSLDRPVLLAGQVLEHLTQHAQPTRSEVCHLHDVLSRGYRGIVLSDETAIGDDPVRALREASALLEAFTGA